MMDKKSYYLDKLGVMTWLPRQNNDHPPRILLIHDEENENDNKLSILLDNLNKGLHLSATNARILAYLNHNKVIASYLARFEMVIIFGQGLSSSIGEDLLKTKKRLHIVPRRLSDGLTPQDKKTLYLFYNQWAHSYSA